MNGPSPIDFFAVIRVSTLEEMTCAKDRYFGLNRVLLLAAGLWPYAQSKLIWLQLTLQYGILGSFIVLQALHEAHCFFEQLLTYKDNMIKKQCTYNDIKIVQIFISSFNVSFFVLLLNGLLYASLNLYRIFREISSGCIGEKLIQSLLIMNIYYVYTFIANNVTQQVLDHNNNVFTTVYNVQWYVAPLHVQKLILFLLQRGSKTLKIVIGGLFEGSLEGFATLASASMSYFTFIYYTNQ
ncbi:PREDICTED: uncharacterized protein LOC105460565 [Wasmannia auropunctata]|uniref:uncharacterized protein LOC105460565 n=1 Tax=Wasmannia auropunctata TaxID=64793 RepID=UPI0005EE586B|nr:PREDICTED: uncharacterized protein LOC105460565 [Wasmannia auropunctata]